MEGFLVYLVIITAVAAARFDIDSDPSAGESYFIDIPWSVPDAQTAEWKRTSRPAGPLPQLTMYCPDDKVVCALYDDTEYIAGLQVAVSKLEFTENVFDWKKRGFTFTSNISSNLQWKGLNCIIRSFKIQCRSG